MNIMCELVWCGTMLCVVVYNMQFWVSCYIIRKRSEIEINEKSKNNKMEKYEKIKMIIYVMQLIYVLIFLWSFSGMRRIIIYSFQSAFQLKWVITSNGLCVDVELTSTKEVYFLCMSDGTVSTKRFDCSPLFITSYAT